MTQPATPPQPPRTLGDAVTIDIIEQQRPGSPPKNAEPRTGAATLHIPTHIVLNGQTILMPKDAKIRVEASCLDATTVTITMFAQRVRIGHHDEIFPAPQDAA